MAESDTASLIAVILKTSTFVCGDGGAATFIESKSFCALFGELSPAAVGYCRRSAAGIGAGATRAPEGQSALCTFRNCEIPLIILVSFRKGEGLGLANNQRLLTHSLLLANRTGKSTSNEYIWLAATRIRAEFCPRRASVYDFKTRIEANPSIASAIALIGPFKRSS